MTTDSFVVYGLHCEVCGLMVKRRHRSDMLRIGKVGHEPIMLFRKTPGCRRCGIIGGHVRGCQGESQHDC